MRFAINHISAPGMPLAEFFAMNRRLGVSEVEIRNDIPDIVGSMAPRAVRAEAEAQGITILSINALYPFNVWSGDLPDRARRLADYAAEAGALALVMCPLNDGGKAKGFSRAPCASSQSRTRWGSCLDRSRSHQPMAF